MAPRSRPAAEGIAKMAARSGLFWLGWLHYGFERRLVCWPVEGFMPGLVGLFLVLGRLVGWSGFSVACVLLGVFVRNRVHLFVACAPPPNRANVCGRTLNRAEMRLILGIYSERLAAPR